MKKTIKYFLIFMIGIFFIRADIYAGEGSMGFFGGITEGDHLPKTIEKFVEKKKNKSKEYTIYKEYIFLADKPVEVTGTLTTTIDTSKTESNPKGVFTEQYKIEAKNDDGTVVLKRNVKLTTSFRNKEGSFKRQLIKDSSLDQWTETITTPEREYRLDQASATFSKSSVVDKTPGVDYYNTALSYNLRYLDGDNKVYNVSMSGDVYGYDQAWSAVEAQYLTMNIVADGFKREVKIRPKQEAKKTMYYTQAGPYPISFAGTYTQRMERQGTLSYEIMTYDQDLRKEERKNSTIARTAHEIEQLPIPARLDFLRGHWGEEDMKRIYSMEIFTDYPHQGMQYEAMKRGEFIKALCLAMDIDTEEFKKPKKNAPIVFGDVPADHPLYPYIMGAYKAKLIRGTGEHFSVNDPITRQEAYVMCIRVIGLERLGVSASPITPFVDDGEIDSWAKREIMAGYQLGIIRGDEAGKVKPLRPLSKIESAAIINRLIDYLRTEISEDY